MRLCVVSLIILAVFSLAGCSSSESENALVVTSESLTADGKWITAISSTSANPKGDNLSPQLSWNDVKGAAVYAIYMVDRSANQWLHWRAKDVTVTNLKLGESLANSEYIGPYPPGGVHEYEIIVYALKSTPDKYAGLFNAGNYLYDAVEEQLDTANGKRGNILAQGSVTGTVTVGEQVEP